MLGLSGASRLFSSESVFESFVRVCSVDQVSEVMDLVSMCCVRGSSLNQLCVFSSSSHLFNLLLSQRFESFVRISCKVLKRTGIHRSKKAACFQEYPQCFSEFFLENNNNTAASIIKADSTHELVR